MSPRLHLSCAPYPSAQGTQAAVGAMVAAERRAGLDARLVTYGAAHVDDPPYVTRIARTPRPVPAASGPGFARLVADAAVVAALVRLRPSWVVAHHVEAALACMVAKVPFVYVAHTHVAAELPSYGRATAALAPLGAALERAVLVTARATFAVTPALAARLPGARPLVIPWPPSPVGVGPTRAAARSALGLADDTLVVLHAGNLDAYQNLGDLARAVAHLAARRPARLLVATESAGALPRLAGPPPLRVGLRDEAARSLVHAAADVAASARTLATGLPVKLLDAMARDVPVAAYRAAFAGDPIERAAIVVPSSPVRLAEAFEIAAVRRDDRPSVALEALHGDAAYLAQAPSF